MNDRGVLNRAGDLEHPGAICRMPSAPTPLATVAFVRWRPGRRVESYIDGLATAHDGALQMIDTLIVRVDQHGHATQYLCSQSARAGGNVVTSG